jgi:hypothetical protein
VVHDFKPRDALGAAGKDDGADVVAAQVNL